MSKSARLVLPAIFLAFVGFLVYSTFHLDQVRVHVCMEFEGKQACKTASGATREDALQTAKTNACGELTSGMGNTRRCAAQEPVSTEWLD